jgi:hypothetical protein
VARTGETAHPDVVAWRNEFGRFLRRHQQIKGRSVLDPRRIYFVHQWSLLRLRVAQSWRPRTDPGLDGEKSAPFFATMLTKEI